VRSLVVSDHAATWVDLEPVARRQYRCNVLDGAVMANLFFEASTRTRISFHTAFSRLGGRVCDTTGFTFSSISKGESLEDTARVIAGYADAIVMRHPETGSVAQFAKGLRVPVINAGDGTGEHPSQALLDYYTISSEFDRLGKTIDGMTIAMVGDLKHGRTIHSLCRLLRLFVLCYALVFSYSEPSPRGTAVRGRASGGVPRGGGGVFPGRARMLHIREELPRGKTPSFPRDYAVFLEC